MNETVDYDAMLADLLSVLPPGNAEQEFVSHTLETGSRVDLYDEAAYMICDDGVFVAFPSPRIAVKHVMFCQGLSGEFHV